VCLFAHTHTYFVVHTNVYAFLVALL
jgi:hypothetical protein